MRNWEESWKHANLDDSVICQEVMKLQMLAKGAALV